MELRARRQEARSGENVARDLLQLGVAFPARARLGRLVREDDRLDGDRPAVLVGDGKLALRIGAQERHRARLAQLREVAQQCVRVDERRRHEALRLVRRVAEHHALVARALLLGLRAVDALRDVGALPVEGAQVVERVPAEPLAGAVVADVLHDRARDLLGVHLLVAARRDFAHVDDEVRPHHRLARDVGLRVALEVGVEDRVGNLVRNLVGMTFRNRFGSENVPSGMFCHVVLSFFVLAKRIRGGSPATVAFPLGWHGRTGARFLMLRWAYYSKPAAALPTASPCATELPVTR